MFDYKGIEALYMVQKLQSFEGAAEQLHITQSAVSQRIKSLETYYAEPLLIRSFPYRATKLGEELIGHFKRVALLEEDFKNQLGTNDAPFRFKIALNRDSLETWFLAIMQTTSLFQEISLEILADDQEKTLDYLKKGLVSAALSTSEQPVLGGKAEFLGSMEYVLVASPSFVKKYFSQQSAKTCLRLAPALKFDQHDHLHNRYLEKFFGLKGDELSYCIMPSVQGFKQCALQGYAYGLLPKIDVYKELKSKKLLQLYSDKIWNIPLYWHYWTIESKRYQKFNAELIVQVRKYLKETP